MEQHDILNHRMLLKQLVQIPDEKIDAIAKLTKKIRYKKNDFFSTPENPSTFITIISKGIFKQYAIDMKGNEIIREFRGENMFMTSYAAIISDQFQPIYVQALEDSEVFAIKRIDFMDIWKDDIVWKDILQKQTELDCFGLMKREFSFLQSDAKTRYLDFLKDFHQYADRIKLRDIASYLGITPEALSRIRSSPL